MRCFIIIVSIAAIARASEALESTQTEFTCAATCTCASEHVSDLPIMKWLTLPMNGKFNNIRKNNKVSIHEVVTPESEEAQLIQLLSAPTMTVTKVLNPENEDLVLARNPSVYAAYCLQPDNSPSIRSADFAPAVEALTLLYGPDSLNKTIQHELVEFSKLIALDVEGYKSKHFAMQLHHDALLETSDLRYLNVKNIRIIPLSNATRDPSEVSSRSQFNIHNVLNLTFAEPEEPEILPYDEYMKRESARSIFSHLTYLHFLRLFRCHVTTITRAMFDGLRNLRTLSLQNNRIKEIPEDTFASTPRLQSLILSKNHIELVHDRSFSGLSQLETLDLSGNQLRVLSNTTFAALPKLNSLNLLDNPLEKLLSNTFEKTNAIQNLWIGSTGGLVVQEDAFATLGQLENLVLLGLNVTALHKGILRGLTNLTSLRASGNIESLVFDTFTGSVLLEELILRRSSLKAISVDAFYGLRRLKRLDLSHNKLETLQPGVFDELTSLEELILAYNHFVMLPRAVLANLQHVNMIRLEANPWNCSCDMAGWTSLKLNTKRAIRTIKQPCDYQNDKIPCAAIQTESYIQDWKVTPKCETPSEYKGWDVVRAVRANRECEDEEEMFVMKPRKRTKKRRNLEIPKAQEMTDVGTADDRAHTDNEDNDAADSSPYFDSNNALFSYHRMDIT